MRRFAGAAVVAALLALGTLYALRGGREAAAPIDSSGFDLSAEGAPTQILIAVAPAVLGAGPSGLGMILPGSRPSSAPAAAPAGGAGGLRAYAQRSEGACTRLFNSYRDRYPVVARFERDWMADPELRRARDEYMQGGRDPIKFLQTVARAKGFPGMVTAYAREPAMQALAREQMQAADPRLIAGGMEYLNKDGSVRGLAASVLASLGLPPILLTGGGAADPNAMIQSVLQSNPGARAALQQAAPAPDRR